MTALVRSLLANSRIEIAVVGQTISHYCKRCKGLQGGVDVRVPKLGRGVLWRELSEGDLGCGGDFGLPERLDQQGLRKFRLELIQQVIGPFAFDAFSGATSELQLNDHSVALERDCWTGGV